VALGPRIALWGPYDIADYHDLLVPRILERELLARLPLTRVDRYAPLGSERPIALDGGRATLPLGLPTPHRKRQLADRHDLIVVTGDVVHTDDLRHQQFYDRPDLPPSEFFVDGLGDALERRCPVVWSSVGVPLDFAATDAERIGAALARRTHVSVRDQASRERLLAIAASVDTAVVPEVTALAAHAFSPDVLNRRLDYLRALGSFPEDGRPVVVSVDVASEETEAAVKRRFPGAPLVFVDFHPEGGPATAAPRDREVFTLPNAVTVEDLTAVLANAQAIVSMTRAQALAGAFDVPLFLLTGGRLESLAKPAEMGARIDRELDVLAALAEQSWSRRVAGDPAASELLAQVITTWEERYQALRAAYESRGERLLVERLRFAEIVERLEETGGELPAELAERMAELENAVFTAQAAEAEARYKLARLMGGAESDA
jgi:Polysaccharide pyruvyl transferase